MYLFVFTYLLSFTLRFLFRWHGYLRQVLPVRPSFSQSRSNSFETIACWSEFCVSFTVRQHSRSALPSLRFGDNGSRPRNHGLLRGWYFQWRFEVSTFLLGLPLPPHSINASSLALCRVDWTRLQPFSSRTSSVPSGCPTWRKRKPLWSLRCSLLALVYSASA